MRRIEYPDGEHWEGEYPNGCNTAMPSKIWMRKNEDITATKQKWYCCDCRCGYKVKYGTIVELRMGNNVYLARAEIPFDTMKDLKAAVVQATNHGTSLDTLEKLFKSFPALKPMAANNTKDAFFRQAIPGETTPDRPGQGNATSQEELTGCYRFNFEDYEDLPTLAWVSILTVFAKAGRAEELVESLEGLITEQHE